MPKVSVIIPVYNVENYLKECLDSVLNQDFDDFEVICVEDCSTDLSLKILKEYDSKYSFLRVIQHEKNMGLSCARNTGIEAAKGEYIQFVDSDDMIHPGAIKTLYSNAKKNDVDILYFNMEFYNDEANNLVRQKLDNKTIEGIYSGKEMFCIHQEINNLKPEAVRHFIRRDFLRKKGIRFYSGIIHEDVLFSFNAAMMAKRVFDLNEELYVYRQRTDSISWSQKNKSADSLFVCLVNIVSYWMTNEFTENENKWIASYIKVLYSNYKRCKCYKTDPFNLMCVKEKALYDIININVSSEFVFDETDIKKLKESDVNILYGAGQIGSEMLCFFDEHGIRISYIAVTDIKGNAPFLNGIPVKNISDLSELKNGIVVLGTDEKWHDSIISNLTKYGFKNIIKALRKYKPED